MRVELESETEELEQGSVLALIAALMYVMSGAASVVLASWPGCLPPQNDLLTARRSQVLTLSKPQRCCCWGLNPRQCL